MSPSAAPLRVERVRPDVLWLHPPDGGEMYVVTTDRGPVVFDTGFLKFMPVMVDAVRAAGLDPHAIRLGFVTHLHADHVGAMGAWSREFGFPVAAHELAAGPIEAADPVATGAKMVYAGMDEEFVPCPVRYRLQGGESFQVGNRRFRVIHAPGHTVGSIHIHSGDLLFVGDTLFGNGGIGWMDVHWGSNPEDYVETLERLRSFRGCFTLAGHGAPYVLTDEPIDKGTASAAFHIPYAHGLGSPRVPSLYGKPVPPAPPTLVL